MYELGTGYVGNGHFRGIQPFCAFSGCPDSSLLSAIRFYDHPTAVLPSFNPLAVIFPPILPDEDTLTVL
jgi:hypothetical protein